MALTIFLARTDGSDTKKLGALILKFFVLMYPAITLITTNLWLNHLEGAVQQIRSEFNNR